MSQKAQHQLIVLLLPTGKAMPLHSTDSNYRVHLTSENLVRMLDAPKVERPVLAQVSYAREFVNTWWHIIPPITWRPLTDEEHKMYTSTMRPMEDECQKLLEAGSAQR